MSSLAYLSIGAPAHRPDSDQERPFVLIGRNDVPTLWACGFTEADLRIQTKERDEDDDDRQDFVFECTVGALRQRIAAITARLSESEYLREVWAGCGILLEVLQDIPDDAPAILDANEVAAMSDRGALQTALSRQTKAFAELRARWQTKLAMTLAARPDALTGVLASDRRRARRVTNSESERAAFFTLMFGIAEGQRATIVRNWLASAVPGEPLPSLEDDAASLADALISRGVIQLANEKRSSAVRFLRLAARFRTPEALQEILDLLFAQHLVSVDAQKPCSWRAFDRVVGPDQADAVPVFDREVLASVVETIGD